MNNAFEMFLDSLPKEIEDFKKTGNAEWASDELKNFMTATDDAEEIIQAIIDCHLPRGDGFNEEIFSHNYRFVYLNKTDSYKEYDGIEFNAPNEDVAWCFFLGHDGEFNMPNERDYQIELVG